MKISKFVNILSILVLAVTIWTSAELSVNAQKRPIFGENLKTINKYFGHYWTRLTWENNAGNRLITYTYNPSHIRKLFPKADVSKLEVTFTNNRANYINIGMTIILQEFAENGYPVEFDALFEYIFGYRPSSQSSIYRKLIRDGAADPGGTLHESAYCVNDGIAIAYEYASERDLAIRVSFSQEAECNTLL